MQYPTHIAIIPDGNRTWAEEQGLPKIEGHLAGQENSINLMKYIFSETPIEVATFWGLSFENAKKRSPEELGYLFTIYKAVLAETIDFMQEHEISFKRVGNPTGLPDDLLDDLKQTESQLRFATEKTAIFAINYGGRDEIIRGIKKRSAEDGDTASLDEEAFGTYLDFGDLPPVDLVIRTKGDEAKRLSGFMLRRIAYAELYFTPLKFPAFDTAALEVALQRFAEVAEKRNFGK